jgi:hypothetical protein
MPFPASQQTLKAGLDSAIATAASLQQFVSNARNASAAGNVGRFSILNLSRQLGDGVTSWNAIAALPGIVAYGQAQYGSALDIAGEFTAMVNAAAALRDWIIANFPKDVGSGAVLVYTVNASGQLTELQFTSAQLAPFRTQADTFLATIS